MKYSTLQAALGSALVLLSHQCHASAHHRHAHRHFHQSLNHTHGHSHSHAHFHSHDLRHEPEDGENLEKRGTCAFPYGMDPNLVPVTPGAANAGWAMSPDQPCVPGWCPYACAPGMVGTQWQPGSIYAYPQSMNGGLQCNSNGQVSKPFPNQPLCAPGTGAVTAVNGCGKEMSFCQTVLPGNEAMLIPTVIGGGASQVLAVPSINYWAETAAHFYLNPPGTGAEGCIWGSPAAPVGNWAPYVAGANTVAGGLTFVKIGYNPIWTSSPLANTMPSFGIRITCDQPGCNGLPCSIDPSQDGIGVTNSPVAADGAGGASFCVITVPPGGTSKIEVFDISGSDGAPGPSSPAPAASPVPAAPSASASPSIGGGAPPSGTMLPGIFHENSSSISVPDSSGSTPSSTGGSSSSNSISSAVPTTSQKGEAMTHQKGSAAVAGLVIALVAAACLY